MMFDVVPIRSSYRGMGRSLTPEDFPRKCTRKRWDKLIEDYLDYIEDTLKPESRETFERMLSYCKDMKKQNISCEMIVYDSHPLESAYGYPLEFLGIDIVHEMMESLLEDGAERLPKSLLNEHLLCTDVANVPQITMLCDHGGATWLPCWVYRVQE